MTKTSVLIAVVFLSLCFEAHSYQSVAPTWITSPYMRGGFENVIKSLTNQYADPIYTFTFSSALPGVPNLAYGIKQYQGADTLGPEQFEIRRLQLTASTFKVQIDIVGPTNIHIFGIPYLAIDPTFPHHLNSFDNVPLHYGSTFVNLTNPSVSAGTLYYSNTVNYTQQAAGRTYRYFTNPLSSNKILMFICSLSIRSKWRDSNGKYPIDLNINYDILSTTTYRMRADLSTKTRIYKIHFSMIVFNQDDVESSAKYFLVFEYWEVSVNGGFKAIPAEFKTNFIMGILDFETVDGRCGFEYQWFYQYSGSTHGVFLERSVQRTGQCGFEKMKSTIFYMKTWKCENAQPFFNLTTNLCQNLCGNYHYEDYVNKQCLSCENGCIDCTSATHCTECTPGNFRVLSNANCVCQTGYFQNPANSADMKCLPCISNCLTCSSTSTCDICDEANWYLRIPNLTCQYCGYGCDTCNNSKVCQSCRVNYYNQTAHTCIPVCADGWFENDANNQCDPCAFACRTCNDATNCETCHDSRDNRELSTILNVTYCLCIERYYQVSQTQTVCAPCIANCLRCLDGSTCEVCDTANWYILIPNKTCQYCGYGCATCDNNKHCQSCRLNYYNSTAKTCVTTCANGYFENFENNKCDPCSYQCATCDDATNCVTCDANGDHRELAFVSGVQTCVCMERYFQASHFQSYCTPCINQCLSCSSTTTCITCNVDNSFLKIPNGTCHHCGDGCKTCDSNLRCTACSTGYHNPTTYSCGTNCADGYYGDDNTNECEPCKPQCLTCTDNSTCSACSTGHNRELKIINGVQECVCKEKYYEANSSAVACSPCMSECLKCTSGSTCSECNAENDYLLIPNLTCQYCGYGCAACNNNKECTSCSVNYLNEDTHECIANCPNYYFENSANNKCEACSLGCHTCSSATNCESCAATDNRELKTSGGVTSCACKEGFFQASGSSTVCSPCIDGCLSCSSSTTCDDCNENYSYLRIPNGTCQYCGDGCQSCNNDLECQSCSFGFLDPATHFCTRTCPSYQFGNATSGRCQSCSFGCLSCSSPTSCLSCDFIVDRRELTGSSGSQSCACKQGYYQPSTSTTICEPCIQNCLSCSSGTTCNTCDSTKGFLRLPDGTCAECGAGCSSCNNEKQCQSCSVGFWNPETFECVLSCPAYYFENDANKKCEKCSFGCTACTSATTCTTCGVSDNRELVSGACQCKEGFFQASTTNSTCMACIPNCLSCSSSVSCDTCDSSNGYLRLADGTCQNCGEGCASCNDNKECQSCAVGVLNTTTHECVRNCPDYYYETSSNQCEACAFGCQTCTSPTNCLTCSSGADNRKLETISGVKTCVCKEGYYQPSAGTICFSCIRDCVSCSDDSTCDTCSDGFVLIPNSTCQNCGSGCSVCTDSLVCTACKSGYYDSVSKSCLSSCPDYYFENTASKQCDACPFGCHSCSSSTNCLSCDSSTDKREMQLVSGTNTCVCQPGFYQTNTSTTICEPCPANCLTCSSRTTCSECDTQNSYVLIPNGTCQNCGVGCSTCNDNLKCQGCATGYLDSTRNNSCVQSCLDYFFENTANNKCESCAFGCQTCTNSTNCVSCDEQNDHREMKTVSGVNTCLCQPGFFESSTSTTTCSACIANCLSCSSSTDCDTCDEDQGYLLVPDGTCQNCGSGCESCNDNKECLECKSGFLDEATDRCVTNCPSHFFANTTSEKCEPCAYGCSTCSSPTDCLSCDSTNDHREMQNVSGVKTCLCKERYYQRTVSTSQCFPCIDNCLSCSTDSTCLECDTSLGYSLVPRKTCELCGLGCVTCNNDIECKECQSGYFLNESSKTCTTKCAEYHFGNADKVCEPCVKGCSECSDNTACFSCNSTDNRQMVRVNSINTCVCLQGFYQDPDPSKSACLKCLPNCETCADGASCDTCVAGSLLLPNGTCFDCGNGCDQCNNDGFCESCVNTLTHNPKTGKCECPLGQYTENSDMSCGKCSDRCKTCGGPSQYECESCHEDQNRILVRQRNGFVQCICDPQNFIESSSGDPVCVEVSRDACKTGYFYLKSRKKCIEICGDGLDYGNYECDDGNKENGDGCSAKCKIQKGFDCAFNRFTLQSTCTYTGQVDIKSAEAFKHPLRNSLRIECVLDPIEDFFYTLNWKDGIVLVGPKMEVRDSWMEDSKLKIEIDYFEDLTGKTLTIKYSSKNAQNRSNRRLFSTAFDFDLTLRDYELPIAPANNLEAVYFEEGTYEMVQVVQSMTFLVAVITLAIIAMGMCLKTPFPLLHLALALQLMFLSMGVINSMNPVLSTVTEFSPIKGLRSKHIYFEEWTSPHGDLSYNIQILGYVTSFFGNMNVMLFMQFAMLMLTLAFFLMATKDLHLIEAYHVCKRQLMLLVFFNAMNISFSVGLFVDSYAFEVIVCILSVLTLGLQAAYFIHNLRHYFGMELTFDLQQRERLTKIFIGVLLGTKVLSALLISTLRESTMVPCVVILLIQTACAAAFTKYQPYRHSFHNRALVVVEWTAAAFTLLNLINKLQVVSPDSGEQYLSLFQVALTYVVSGAAVAIFGLTLREDYHIGMDKSVHPSFPLQIEEGESSSSEEEKSKREEEERKQKNKFDENKLIAVEDIGHLELEIEENDSQHVIQLDSYNPEKNKKKKTKKLF